MAVLKEREKEGRVEVGKGGVGGRKGGWVGVGLRRRRRRWLWWIGSLV
jgi:hypothetical protein